jgi:hypothetical protein
MFLVYQLQKILLHLVPRLILLLTVLFTTFYQMEIALIALKKEFVPEVYAVFVSADLVKSIHIQLQLK